MRTCTSPGLAICLAFVSLQFSGFVFAGNPPPGFTALFNGRDLDGWWGAKTENPRDYLALSPDEFRKKHDSSLDDIRAHWSVENDEIVNDGKGLYLTTGEFYGDFELLLEYKTVARADSGIYLRGCPQVQIWDYTDPKKFHLGADKGSGALWNNSKGAPGKDPLVKADKPFGEWNHIRVIMAGARVWVWLNAQLTVDGAYMENFYERSLPVPPRGPIQLQTHGGEIRWRNLFIREIGAAEASKLLRSRAPDEASGFKQVFNGKNLDGWAGPAPVVRIEDSAITWQPKRGGTLYTKEEFSNFIVRLEFKLPPAPSGGNNGLAIRYPGAGNPAYDGMCEIQVLNDEYEKVTGKKIDPRQTHGSLYGMAAAQRGYQRPAGEWNYQEVTVNGSRITVELNGTIITDADLAKITEYKGNTPHPGKNRSTGHFGFAGHGDEVMFRNISIKRLD